MGRATVSRFKRVAGFSGKSGKPKAERDDEHYRCWKRQMPASGKASKHQVTSNHTPNQVVR